MTAKAAPVPGPDLGPILRLWRGAALFAGAPDPALTALAMASAPFRVGAGQILFHRGDPGDSLFLLSEGRIKLTLLSAQGRELVLRHADAGDFLGEMAFFDGSARSAMAVAYSDCAGVVLGKSAYARIAVEHRADLNAAALAYLCQTLRQTTERLEGIALFDLPGRLARYLLARLTQMHGNDLPPDPTLRLTMTQSDLAAMLGASRPKVNRALQELEATGAIQRKGQLIRCDTRLLRALASGDALS